MRKAYSKRIRGLCAFVSLYLLLISLSGCATLTHNKNFSSHNSDAYAHYCMGVIYENKGAIAKAIGEYEGAVGSYEFFKYHEKSLLMT